MFETLQLFVLGAWLIGYAIGNIMFQRESRGMALASVISLRVVAIVISAFAAAISAAVAIFISIVSAVLFQEKLGLSHDALIYGTFTLSTLASFLASLFSTRSFCRAALRKRGKPSDA